MDVPTAGSAAWARVIDELNAVSGQLTEGEVRERLRRSRGLWWKREKIDVPSRHVRIQVIERESKTVLTLRWRGPTCHYAEQAWRLVAARVPGVCLLSGAQIRRGDPIFKPKFNSSHLNEMAMILGSEIDRVAPFENPGALDYSGDAIN